MRAASELRESKAEGTLGKQILVFAQGFRSLLVPSPEVLAETVVILHPLVALSDKVLPLKSYFNMVQQVQRTTHLAWALAQALTKDLPTGTPAEVKAKAERAAALEVELRAKGAVYLAATLAEETKKSTRVTAQATPEQRAAVERDLLQKLDQDAQRRLCTEDVFMVACSFLEVEIAKQGSVYYLKGESPDFKETKKNRNPLNLSDEVVLKTLSSGLARPDEERGAVERGQIDSGFNHLVRLNKLHLTMTEVVRWIKEGDQKNTPRRKIDVRKHFGLSHTDYERIMSMARREGMISFRNRKKDPSNSYVLRAKNHQRVVEYAEKFGHSPQKTLNKILDDFFDLIEKRREKSTVGS